MESSVTTMLALTLFGMAILVIAAGVCMIRVLRQQKTILLMSVKRDEEQKKFFDKLSAAGIYQLPDRLIVLDQSVQAVHNRIAFISNELVSWNARSAAMVEALQVVADGVSDLNVKMEKNMPKVRFVELGDAMPAMGVIEDPAVKPPAAESIPQKRKRKPAKKAAKKRPAKKAAKRKPAKVKAKK